ncbi:MAG: hypothetical protein ACJ768_12770 [Gaiellaceae bacterium]
MATTTATPWQQTILNELGDRNDEIGEADTHAAVWIPADDNAEPELLGVAASELGAVVVAEDKAAAMTGGEARVVKLADLAKWSAANATGRTLPTVDGPVVEPRRQNVETEEGDAIEQPADGEDGEEDGDGEKAPATEPLVEDDGQTAAFNKDGYIPEPLQLPKVDGEGIDKIGAKFGGLVRLDRSQAPDCALVRDLKLGTTVTLMVECEVGPPVPGYTTNKDGDLDALALVRQFKVVSVYRPTAEEL